MNWAHPEHLKLLWVLPVFLGLMLLAHYRRLQVLRKIGKLETMLQMSRQVDPSRRQFKGALVLAALFCLILALAGPQVKGKLVQVKHKAIDLIVAIDVSRSMLAEDIKPNRLERAKLELKDLIERLQGDRVGLIVFAGEAFVNCPLTTDYSAVTLFLSAVSPDLIPTPGTAIGPAIEAALSAFVDKEGTNKILILLTDGEDHDPGAVQAAQKAAKKGLKVFTIGIGQSKGEPIPLRQDGRLQYLKDRSGQIVMSKLDESSLQKIASITGGRYYRSTGGEIETEALVNDINQVEKKEIGSLMVNEQNARFQIPLLFAFGLLLIEWLLSERRRRS